MHFVIIIIIANKKSKKKKNKKHATLSKALTEGYIPYYSSTGCMAIPAKKNCVV